MTDAIYVTIDGDEDNPTVDPVTGDVATPQGDGGVVVAFGAARRQQEDDGGHFANLAEKMDGQQLGQIVNELIEAIEADDRSRKQALEIRDRGLDLLGIQLKEPKSTIGESSAPVEGMSSVTNPMLLEAVLKGWANSQAELLPADGPAKIKDISDEATYYDDLAEALERDFNHYLTDVATEYYPDTSHMLLWGVYFGGSGFKKVYRCPMRRRPVSESVDMKDLILSDTTKDLRNCARITHQIMMRPSVMARMKFIGAYRDVQLTQPQPDTSVVDNKIAMIQGVAPEKERPEDQPFTVWETQCELDLPQFAPKAFAKERIPLPYRVTLEKDSREILALRRDWDEEDEDCERIKIYVRYPYIPGPGVYGTGLLHILGNCTSAMTAAWREALDAGMFANFPAGLISKLGGRQNTVDMRMAPGQWTPIETGSVPIGQVVFPNPYRDVTPGLMALMDKITAQAQAVAGAGDVPTSEGVQNVPVGTMLAQIEQATKVIAAAHKGLHQAQSEEFQLLLALFRDNPHDFFRWSRGSPPNFWDEQKFVEALRLHRLVPRSDPNIPSHMHRVAKASALVQLASMPMFSPFFNLKEVLTQALITARYDPTNLLVDPQPQQGPDASQGQAQLMTAQARMQDAQTKQVLAQAKMAQTNQQIGVQAAKLQTEQQIAQTDLQKELVIHQADQARLQRESNMDAQSKMLDIAQQRHDAMSSAREHDMEMRRQAIELAKAQHDMTMDRTSAGLEQAQHEHQVRMDRAQHELETQRAENEHKVAMKQASQKPAASKEK